MKIKDFVAYLSTLDQEADILWAEYYYADREGFVLDHSDLARVFVRPQDTEYYKHYAEQGNVYLFDQWCV